MSELRCPYCQNDDKTMIEKIIHSYILNRVVYRTIEYHCEVCSKSWKEKEKEND